MNLTRLLELSTVWREEAALYRRRGMDSQATMAESYAAELAERVNEWQAEELTLEQASEESGYSYSSIQGKVAKGKIANAGEKRSPRIRRGDLPFKGRRRVQDGQPDVAGEVLAARLEVL